MALSPVSNSETRDIAVIANTKVDQHIQECVNLRLQMMDNFDRLLRHVNTRADALAEDIKDLSNNNSRLSWTVAAITGGLILLTRIPDLINFFK